MFKNWLIYLLCALSFVPAYAQSEAEIKNRGVYNQIEFFYNSQRYESIYKLASSDFKKQVSEDHLTSIFSQLQLLGRIKESVLENFEDNRADYKLTVGKENLLLQLSVDTSKHFTMLLLKPYVTKKEIIEENEIPIISKAAIDKPIDYYVDSIAQAFAKQKNAQSIAIGIVHKNQTSTYFYGSLVKGADSLANENTVYEIGSITKTFTATLLADLVDRQIISLDESIAKFLPDSVAQNPAIQKLTFKTLANHTSGLPRLPTNLATTPFFTATDPYAHYDQKALFAYLKTCKPSREPESEYEYSNVGYGLLGELISIITKKPFSKLIADVITQPLNLTNTFDKPTSKTYKPIKVYNEKGNETPQWNWQAMSGTGALKSSVKDLLAYAKTQFIMPETDLQKAMALTRQFTFFNPPETDIGLAWHMNMLEDGVIYYHHTGGTYGSSSFIALAPDEKTTVIILSNSALSVNNLGLEILNKLLHSK